MAPSEMHAGSRLRSQCGVPPAHDSTASSESVHSYPRPARSETVQNASSQAAVDPSGQTGTEAWQVTVAASAASAAGAPASPPGTGPAHPHKTAERMRIRMPYRMTTPPSHARGTDDQ